MTNQTPSCDLQQEQLFHLQVQTIGRDAFEMADCMAYGHCPEQKFMLTIYLIVIIQ